MTHTTTTPTGALNELGFAIADIDALMSAMEECTEDSPPSWFLALYTPVMNVVQAHKAYLSALDELEEAAEPPTATSAV